MVHTLSILVEDESGVLIRMAGLFARRGFNIDSLAVGISEEKNFSRVTMVVPGNLPIIEQLIKQLYKLINVVRIENVITDDTVERQLMLIRVQNNNTEEESRILRIAEIYKAKIVDFQEDYIMVKTSGNSGKVISLKRRLQGFGLDELASTGRVAMSRTLDTSISI
jgi:acetolactate synthase-1/3 small subunit